MTVETDIDAIVRRDLAEPHRLLGAHADNGGVVIRTFRPDAAKVVAKPEGKEPVELELRHPGGVFEGTIEGASLPLKYELEVCYSAGRSRCATRTRSCRRSARSTCTSRARAATRSCTRSSARTCARWRASPGSRSPCGRRRRAR
jgi:alpha-1,4-glucan branchign enzyme GlgB-like protein